MSDSENKKTLQMNICKDRAAIFVDQENILYRHLAISVIYKIKNQEPQIFKLTSQKVCKNIKNLLFFCYITNFSFIDNNQSPP